MTIRRHRRRLWPAVPARLRGLRPRLVLAFVLVGLVSGGAATAASYREARTTVLEATQNAAMNKTREEVNRAVTAMNYPPDQTVLTEVLDELKTHLAGQDRLQVEYGNLVAASALPIDVPAELRRQIRAGNGMRYQRVIVDDVPYLVYGMPVLTEGASPRPSGVEVYAVASLIQPQLQVELLAWSAARYTAVSLVLAVLLGLVAARGVLRPVRNLRQAARRLAEGELDIRLRVRGSDELADLVLTFNNTAADLEYSVGRLRLMESNARRFVADVSHELRTPLAAMTAVTDTLDEEADTLPPDAATAARLVSTETRRLARLVENLMEITRFDAGRAELRLDGEVELAAAISATLAARGWTEQVEVDLRTGLVA
ncbi:MAG TPA: histidine kinase dimerization/phospho-acceptor domain-containing protein, partial [Catenuloplanes sp.]